MLVAVETMVFGGVVSKERVLVSRVGKENGVFSDGQGWGRGKENFRWWWWRSVVALLWMVGGMILGK